MLKFTRGPWGGYTTVRGDYAGRIWKRSQGGWGWRSYTFDRLQSEGTAATLLEAKRLMNQDYDYVKDVLA